jgi:hypothetical protein
LNQHEYAKAKVLAARALVTLVKTMGAGHPASGKILVTMGQAEHGLKNLERASELIRRGLNVQEKSLAANHPATIESMELLATVERELGRGAEADALSKRAEGLREKRAARERDREAAAALKKLTGESGGIGRPDGLNAPRMQSKQIKMH